MLINDENFNHSANNFNSDKNNLQNGYKILNNIETKLRDYLQDNFDDDNVGYRQIKEKYKQNDIHEENHFHFECPELPAHISYPNESRRSQSRLTNKDIDDAKFDSRLKGAYKRMTGQDSLQSNHHYSDFLNKLDGDYAVNVNGVFNYRRSTGDANIGSKDNRLADINIKSREDVGYLNKLKELDNKIVKYQQENDDLLKVKT